MNEEGMIELEQHHLQRQWINGYSLSNINMITSIINERSVSFIMCLRIENASTAMK